MKKPSKEKQVIALLKTAVNTIAANRAILFPFCIGAFVQLLALEILYFAPRFPFSIFFLPIIKSIWSEAFLHYPFNFVLLPKLFYYAQIIIYIFLGSFLSAVAIAVVAAINSGKKVTIRPIFKETSSSNIHIMLAAVLSFSIFLGLSASYQLVLNRADLIRSVTGPLFLLKTSILVTEPYVNLLVGVLVSSLLAFVIPIIVVEKRKVFTAFLLNFKYLWKSFWFVFVVVLLPTLLYVPVLLLRNSIATAAQGVLPGVQIGLIAVSVIVTLAIDATVL